MRGQTGLERTRDRLARWRKQNGGPGIPLPEELWAAAVDVARVEGVEATARVLRVDRLRLAARMGRDQAADEIEASGEFVELDAGQLRVGLSPRAVVRLVGRDGERLEVELGGGAALDLVELADAFWRRRR
jgi:hypothetical protein